MHVTLYIKHKHYFKNRDYRNLKFSIVAYENFILWKNCPLASSWKRSVMMHIRLETLKFILIDWLVSFLLKPSYQSPCLHDCYIQLLELKYMVSRAASKRHPIIQKPSQEHKWLAEQETAPSMGLRTPFPQKATRTCFLLERTQEYPSLQVWQQNL